MKKVALLAAIAAVALTGCIERGNGEKLGVLTKVAKEGAICPTWEAEIVRGGLVGGSGVTGSAFHFSIESEELANKLKTAMEKQQEVKITYSSELVTFCRSESGNHFLKTFEIIDNKNVGTASTADLSSVSGKIVELLKVQAELIKELAAQVAQPK